ncbi:methyltransferase domain-containing protein [Ochrobactrum teleogrylli]|uniref:methyltransferase domain-containing protein n=1 Tax=Ochrobactrum teleogrylli TaxID=2479765 RepID=UPI00384E4F36
MSDLAAERRQKILSLFDPEGFGLEIGPSYDPFLPKSQGYRVETLDHADTENIRKKYANNASKIEDIDYVTDGGSILDLIGKKGRYDFIYASHVIEHVSDFIRFIADCEALLSDNGTLVLVVPDKRFCFDALRALSTTGDLLQAFHERRKRHTPGQVFDFESSYVKKNGTTIWVDTTLNNMEIANSVTDSLIQYERARTNEHYIDIHAWCFTPASFRLLVASLRSMNFFRSGIEEIITNDNNPVYRFEFYVSLRKNSAIESLNRLTLHERIATELHEITPPASKVFQLQSKIEEANKKIEAVTKEFEFLKSETAHLAKLAEEIQQLQKKNGDLQEQISSLYKSTSWKVSAPLRAIKRGFGKK